jgi:hypothetical protein
VTSSAKSLDTLINEKAREQALASERNVRPLVFVSYSHKDGREKDQLCTHLLGLRGALGLKRSDFILVWSDDKIGTGEKWKEEILAALSEARVALLLITADFLSSEFIMDEEVPAILKRRQREGLVVYPVLAKSCAVTLHDWLVAMQIRPRGLLPVWRRGGDSREELTRITVEICEILRKVLPRRTGAGEPPEELAVREKTHQLSLAVQKAKDEPGEGWRT